MRALPDRVAFASFSTELGEVKTCLNAYQRMKLEIQAGAIRNDTHPDKKLAPKKPVPWIFGVVLLVSVNQQWPLVTRYGRRTVGKICADSVARS
jgi:hypothetical protein